MSSFWNSPAWTMGTKSTGTPYVTQPTKNKEGPTQAPATTTLPPISAKIPPDGSISQLKIESEEQRETAAKSTKSQDQANTT